MMAGGRTALASPHAARPQAAGATESHCLEPGRSCILQDTRGIELVETRSFARWFARLRDSEARARILVRLRRLSLGNTGDVRPVGRGVSELRIDYGPGYRIYIRRGPADRVTLLLGGTKQTQTGDVRRAYQLSEGE